MNELTCQREAFALTPDEHYLNCAYMGPLPLSAQDAGVAGIRAKAAPAALGPEHFFRDSDAARDLFAAIIGGSAARVAIMPSVSYGIATAARNLPCAAGQSIVTAAEQFPSNVYAWRRLARERGAALLMIAPPPTGARGAAWTESLVEAIDERTAIVALPHVHWTDGTRFDLERIGARARSVGAALVVDGTQSIGALPFDVARIQPDAVFCAAYKWLLGPYSVAFGWLGPRFDDGVPIEETWLGRERSEDFQRLIEYTDAYQPGAVRYDVGERSNFALLPMAVASMKLIREWRPERIQEYCDRIFAPVIAELSSMGFRIEDRSWRGAHLFGVRAPAGIPLDRMQQVLKQRRIHASLRGSALRIAPNVYNDAGDAAALLDAIRETASAPAT